MRPDRVHASFGIYCAVLAALAVLSPLSASGLAAGQQRIITVSEETTLSPTVFDLERKCGELCRQFASP